MLCPTLKFLIMFVYGPFENLVDLLDQGKCTCAHLCETFYIILKEFTNLLEAILKPQVITLFKMIIFIAMLKTKYSLGG